MVLCIMIVCFVPLQIRFAHIDLDCSGSIDDKELKVLLDRCDYMMINIYLISSLALWYNINSMVLSVISIRADFSEFQRADAVREIDLNGM